MKPKGSSGGRVPQGEMAPADRAAWAWKSARWGEGPPPNEGALASEEVYAAFGNGEDQERAAKWFLRLCEVWDETIEDTRPRSYEAMQEQGDAHGERVRQRHDFEQRLVEALRAAIGPDEHRHIAQTALNEAAAVLGVAPYPPAGWPEQHTAKLVDPTSHDPIVDVGVAGAVTYGPAGESLVRFGRPASKLWSPPMGPAPVMRRPPPKVASAARREKQAQREGRVLRLLALHPDGLSKNEIQKRLQMGHTEVDKALESLVRAQDVEHRRNGNDSRYVRRDRVVRKRG